MLPHSQESRFWLLALLCLPGVLSEQAVKVIEILPTDLKKTGYWQREFDNKCGMEMLEAHGNNAALSYSFAGSGIVTRFLSCESCSKIEIRIDNAEPDIVDLSKRGFQCPQGSPTFVKTDLEHGNHTIMVKRIDPERMVKVLRFEYLTASKEATPESGGEDIRPLPESQSIFSLPKIPRGVVSVVGRVVKGAAVSVAKGVARQAVSAAVGVVAVAAAKVVLGPVIENILGVGIDVPDDLSGDSVPLVDDDTLASDGYGDDGYGDDGGDGIDWFDQGSDTDSFDPVMDLGDFADTVSVEPDWFDNIVDGISGTVDWLFLAL